MKTSSSQISRRDETPQSHSKKGLLKERKQGENNRLLLTFENVHTIEEALDFERVAAYNCLRSLIIRKALSTCSSLTRIVNSFEVEMTS